MPRWYQVGILLSAQYFGGLALELSEVVVFTVANEVLLRFRGPSSYKEWNFLWGGK